MGVQEKSSTTFTAYRSYHLLTPSPMPLLCMIQVLQCSLENNMPNNDWYEYTSEEMQHLGEDPGDILGLIMHERKPEGDDVQSRKRPLVVVQK